MAEYRPIKTKIWKDEWFRGLSSDEKIVWLFLITNDYVHISGIYEMPIEIIGVMTGVKNCGKVVDKLRQENKIDVKEGFVFIKNYLKHQTNQINHRDNISKSIVKYFKENPKLAKIFNLEEEAPYKPLISPLGK